MNTTTTTETLIVSRLIKAPPARVFAAWTTPEIAQWICPGQKRHIRLAKVDARVGGEFQVEVDSEHCGEAKFRGVYREIKKPARVVFTWNLGTCFPEYSGHETLVTVDLAEKGDGTLVTITHEGLPTDEIRARHGEGWNGSLENLEKLV